MQSLTDNYLLNNGVSIPCFGLGTWQANGPSVVAAIKFALAHGYRMIDTAAAYGNEESVGKAIRESGVPRESIFVTSKLRNAAHGYEATLEAFEKTMRKLDLEYLDLYLIHWPNPLQFRSIWRDANAETWKAFEELYKAKRIRAIGVSNFLPHHIQTLMETAETLPMVNQLRLCPGVVQVKAVDFCRTYGIVVEAYSPFGTGIVFRVSQMKTLAEKYEKSVGQICLRWCLQMGYVPLPKSENPSRIKENADIFNFILTSDDMQFISTLTGCCGEAPDPDTIDF